MHTGCERSLTAAASTATDTGTNTIHEHLAVDGAAGELEGLRLGVKVDQIRRVDAGLRQPQHSKPWLNQVGKKSNWIQRHSSFGPVHAHKLHNRVHVVRVERCRIADDRSRMVRGIWESHYLGGRGQGRPNG